MNEQLAQAHRSLPVVPDAVGSSPGNAKFSFSFFYFFFLSFWRTQTLYSVFTFLSVYYDK